MSSRYDGGSAMRSGSRVEPTNAHCDGGPLAGPHKMLTHRRDRRWRWYDIALRERLAGAWIALPATLLLIHRAVRALDRAGEVFRARVVRRTKAHLERHQLDGRLIRGRVHHACLDGAGASDHPTQAVEHV